MVDIYAINIQEIKRDTITDYDMKGISCERQERIHKLKFINDKKASLLAEKLIHYYMKNICKLSEYRIVTEDTGKLKLDNIDNLHFNISHSGDWVVCAFSNYEVGVDIEKIRDVDLNIARRYYNFQEYEKIICENNRLEQNNLFYLLWTLKESYLKNKGIGIKGLNSQLRFELGKCIIGYEKESMIHKLFYTERFENDYYISVCYDKKDIIIQENVIKIISLKQLFEY